MHQCCWIQLLNDYDREILYHSEKANIVANALGPITRGSLAHLMIKKWELLEEARDSQFKLNWRDSSVLLATHPYRTHTRAGE